MYIYDLINYIIGHMGEYSTISMAVVMLCATLSVLSFTYSMVEFNDYKKEMNETGKKFFISTILSMVVLFFIFILSNIHPFINENYFFGFNFLISNIYLILIIMIFVLGTHIISHIVQGCISSLEILNFLENK